MTKMVPVDTDVATAPRPRISVVIPTLNEARNLPHVAARMPADVDEVVVVDGRSVDDTRAVARRLWPDGIHITQTRTGKGNALACGLAAATGDIVVMIDADGSTDPAEIPAFVGALLAGADYAKGSRFIQGGGSTDITVLRRMGNRVLNRAVNVAFGTRYTDLCYGFNALWRHSMDSFNLPDPFAGRPQWGDGFEIETLINIRAAATRMKVAEVGSFECDRISGESHLNVVRDGLRVLNTIVRETWRGRRAARRARGGRAVVRSIGVGIAAAAMIADGDWAS